MSRNPRKSVEVKKEDTWNGEKRQLQIIEKTDEKSPWKRLWDEPAGAEESQVSKLLEEDGTE